MTIQTETNQIEIETKENAYKGNILQIQTGADKKHDLIMKARRFFAISIQLNAMSANPQSLRKDYVVCA